MKIFFFYNTTNTQRARKLAQEPSLLQFIPKFIQSFEKKPVLQNKIGFVIQSDQYRRGQAGAVTLVINIVAQILHIQLKSKQAARARLQMFMKC